MTIDGGQNAQIQVILINGDMEEPSDVYGEITTNDGSGQGDLFARRIANMSMPNHSTPILCREPW